MTENRYETELIQYITTGTISNPKCLSYKASLPSVPREVRTMSLSDRCPLFIDLSFSSVTNIQASKLKPVDVTFEAFKNKQ